jgi:hypothetical protein
MIKLTKNRVHSGLLVRMAGHRCAVGFALMRPASLGDDDTLASTSLFDPFDLAFDKLACILSLCVVVEECVDVNERDIRALADHRMIQHGRDSLDSSNRAVVASRLKSSTGLPDFVGNSRCSQRLVVDTFVFHGNQTDDIPVTAVIRLDRTCECLNNRVHILRVLTVGSPDSGENLLVILFCKLHRIGDHVTTHTVYANNWIFLHLRPFVGNFVCRLASANLERIVGDTDGESIAARGLLRWLRRWR